MNPDPVAEFVATTFSELSGTESSSITRSVVLEKGFFAGFQFRSGDLRAVWFAESGMVKFYDANGKLVRKVSVDEGVKRAA